VRIAGIVVVAIALVAGAVWLLSGPEVEPLAQGPPTECAKRAAPLTATEVREALENRGFPDVAVTRDCEGMAVPLNADVVSGALLVDCAVYGPGTSWGHKIRSDGPAPHSSVMWHGIKAFAALENVACQLYPNEGHEQEQMSRLVGALSDLKRRAV
jgi:hypothetical protein